MVTKCQRTCIGYVFWEFAFQISSRTGFIHGILADDGPFIAVFGSSIPSSSKKVIKFGHPLTKPSGSAHDGLLPYLIVSKYIYNLQTNWNEACVIISQIIKIKTLIESNNQYCHVDCSRNEEISCQKWRNLCLAKEI